MKRKHVLYLWWSGMLSEDDLAAQHVIVMTAFITYMVLSQSLIFSHQCPPLIRLKIILKQALMLSCFPTRSCFLQNDGSIVPSRCSSCSMCQSGKCPRCRRHCQGDPLQQDVILSCRSQHIPLFKPVNEQLSYSLTDATASHFSQVALQLLKVFFLAPLKVWLAACSPMMSELFE